MRITFFPIQNEKNLKILIKFSEQASTTHSASKMPVDQAGKQ